MTEPELYIELYYSLIVNGETKYPNETLTELLCVDNVNTTGVFTARYMMDADGKQNNYKILYMNYLSPKNDTFSLPPIRYETMNINLDDNNVNVIAAIANYIDYGVTNKTEKEFQDFTVTYAKGVFETATIVRVYYDNINLTRKVVVMNDAYLKTNQFSLLQSNEPQTIELYYSLIANVFTPVSNDSVINLSNNAPTISYSTITNRYMQNKDGTKSENIITFMTFRLPGSSLLTIPSFIFETMIIITPENDTIQASMVYEDKDTAFMSVKPFQDFAVNSASGIFKGAKNVRIFYNNFDLSRRVLITNYYPDKNDFPVGLSNSISNINKSEPFMTFYIGAVLSPEVRIPNFTTIDLLTLSSNTFCSLAGRKILTEDWEPTDKNAVFMVTRTPNNPILFFPSLSYVIANFKADNGDYLLASGFFDDSGAGFVPTSNKIIYNVISATGMFAPAKTVVFNIFPLWRIVELYS